MTTSTDSTVSRMAFLTTAHILAAGLGFIVVMLIARHHGAEALGQISLALTLMAQAVLITIFGTNQYGVRQVASGNDDTAPLAGSIIFLRLATASAAFAGLLALSFVAPKFNEIQLILLIVGSCVFPICFRLEWISQAAHRTRVHGVIEFSTYAIYASLVIIGIVFSMNLWTVAAARLVAEILVAAIAFVWVTRNFSHVEFRWRSSDITTIARASAPIAGTQLLRGLSFASDVIILGLLVSATDLGHYVPSLRIFVFAVSVIAAYAKILFPRIAAHADSKTDAMYREVGSSLRLTVPIVLAGACLLAVLAKPILTLLFGPVYAQGSTSLQLLCIALVINLYNRHYRQSLIARGRQLTDLKLTAMGTLVHIAGKFALIPFLGIAGAAAGTVLGEVVLLVALRRAAVPLMRPQQ